MRGENPATRVTEGVCWRVMGEEILKGREKRGGKTKGGRKGTQRARIR